MENTPIPFMPAFALADCCARVLSQHRPVNKESWHGERKARAALVREAIQGLRFLWKTGDGMQRSLVHARVNVWLERPVRSAEICAREQARLKKEGGAK